MRVIPVLDLMEGQVVRGVGGRRHEYKAIRSRLTDSAEPLSVAQGLRQEYGVNELYIADLDALQERRPASRAITNIAADGFKLLVDVGLRDVADGQALMETGVERVVVALETSHGPGQLAALVEQLGRESIVFSLDLKQGQPLGELSCWNGEDAFTIAAQAVECGAESLIVLDLSAVGEGQGVPTGDLCRQLRDEFSDVELITGGGVRNAGDLQQLAGCGVDAVLVASALHDGRLTRADLDRV